MTPFTTKTCREGAKGNLRITVPINVVQQLRATGFKPPDWVRLHVDGYHPVFVVARFPPSRPSVTCTLPIWAFRDLKPRDEITARVEDVVPFRAVKNKTGSGIDWLPFVDSAYLPVDDGENLVLHSRHEEPFRIRRFAPEDSLWWLLGFYQAEGSKSKNAPDWVIANANPALLAAVPPALESLGIPRARQYIEVLHAKGQDPHEAEKAFDCVGVRRAATRLRPGAGGHAGVLHVSKSQPLLRLFKALLNGVFTSDWRWPSRQAARDYALGWLDGDGTICLVNQTTVELRLAGLEDEHKVLATALGAAFGWGHNKGSGWKDLKQGTHITLRGLEMVDLLDVHAFRFSMSYVRLLIGLGQRGRGLVNGNRRGAYGRWGLTENGALTDTGEALCRGYKRYKTQIERATQLQATSPHLFGRKGVPNPLSVTLRSQR